MGAQYQDVTTDNDVAFAYALGLDFATGLPDAAFGDRYWVNVFDPAYTIVCRMEKRWLPKGS